MSQASDMQEMLDGLKAIHEDERAEFLAEMRSGLLAASQAELVSTVLMRIMVEKGLATPADFVTRTTELSSAYVDVLLNAVGSADATAVGVVDTIDKFLTGYLNEGLPKEDR